MSLYVQVYMSPLVHSSRMRKIATSVHAAGYFDETQLVGVRADGLPAHEELTDGVSIVRLRGTSRVGNLGRILRAVLWQPKVYLHYRRKPLTVVAAHNVWLLPLCWLLCRTTGATLVYNAHELETEIDLMVGLKQKAARLIESRLIGACALISVVNEPIADWYENEYPIERPVVVGNAPVIVDADVRLRERLGVRADEMLYVHTGNLVEARNVPLILSAFSRSPHHVVFIGDGYMRGLVLSAAADHPNIHWLPTVPHELLVAHVREADVGLCLIDIQLDLSDRLSSPNKLLESLAAVRPALCSDLVEARRLMGPLADKWILSDPEAELDGALERIGKADVATFTSEWSGMATWDDEVAPLVTAYGRLPGVKPPSAPAAD